MSEVRRLRIRTRWGALAQEGAPRVRREDARGESSQGSRAAAGGAVVTSRPCSCVNRGVGLATPFWAPQSPPCRPALPRLHRALPPCGFHAAYFSGTCCCLAPSTPIGPVRTGTSASFLRGRTPLPGARAALSKQAEGVNKSPRSQPAGRLSGEAACARPAEMPAGLPHCPVVFSPETCVHNLTMTPCADVPASCLSPLPERPHRNARKLLAASRTQRQAHSRCAANVFWKFLLSALRSRPAFQ